MTVCSLDQWESVAGRSTDSLLLMAVRIRFLMPHTTPWKRLRLLLSDGALVRVAPLRWGRAGLASKFRPVVGSGGPLAIRSVACALARPRGGDLRL